MLKKLIIITGFSGAGKTHAAKCLEDMGYYCIDNLPPSLLRNILELSQRDGTALSRVAVVMDIRSAEFFADLKAEMDALRTDEVPFAVLFLEADENVLIARFKEARRQHPLSGAGRLSEGIALEREALAPIREYADLVLDTSGLTPQVFKKTLVEWLSTDGPVQTLTVSVVSFGFKHGLPKDADLVFDVRFLPNPHYDRELRQFTGQDERVRAFVMESPVSSQLLQRMTDFLTFLLPHYVAEGKPHLTVAIGCTGGRHRSVVLGEDLARTLTEAGYRVNLHHRDTGRK